MGQALLAYLLVALAAAWVAWKMLPLKRMALRLGPAPAKGAGVDCGCGGRCER